MKLIAKHVLIASLLVLSACAGKAINWDKARTLKVGMTTDETVELMGRPQRIDSLSDGQLYVWERRNVLTGASQSMRLPFVNGKLSSVPQLPTSTTGTFSARGISADSARGLSAEVAARENIVKLYPQNTQERVRELLIGLPIETDDIDHKITVRTPADMGSTISAKLVVQEGKGALVGKVQFFSSDWLFVESYTVVAENYRFESGPVSVSRDNDGGRVWEWHSFVADKKQAEMLSAAASASAPVVRFRGKETYLDMTLNQQEKDTLEKVVALYRLLPATNRQ